MPTTEQQPRRSIAPGATALSSVAGFDEESVSVGKGFSATVNGLIVEGDPPLDKWAGPGRKLRVMEKGSQFAIGDYVLALEERFGEAASQLLDASEGWSLSTLSVYRWLASRVALPDRRMGRLGIRHHLLVAALTPVKQRHWLEKACDEGEDKPWSVARLKKALDEGEDLPVSGFYVLVTCPTGSAQDELMARLEAEGLQVKAIMKRRKAPELAPAPTVES